MANIFGTTEEEEDNLLRLYNPQEYYLQNPYLPPVAQPIAPTPEPVVLPEGSGMGPNQNIEPNPFNPNLVGQYFGYQNPNYPGAPQIDPVTGLPSSAIVQDQEYGYTPIGTNIDDDDEGFNFGDFNPMSMMPGAFIANNIISPLAAYVNNLLGFEDDGMTPTSPTETTETTETGGLTPGGGNNSDPDKDKQAKDMQKDIDQGYGGQNVHG